MSRLTREMFCLMEGRHVHPSTLYPGGMGTVATIQLFTYYLVRLMKYVEFMNKVVPVHDDLFDFFYEALPGYEKVGRRRILLGCWGSYNDPDSCDYTYRNMAEWGRKMFVTPGVVVDGKLVTKRHRPTPSARYLRQLPVVISHDEEHRGRGGLRCRSRHVEITTENAAVEHSKSSNLCSIQRRARSSAAATAVPFFSADRKGHIISGQSR